MACWELNKLNSEGQVPFDSSSAYPLSFSSCLRERVEISYDLKLSELTPLEDYNSDDQNIRH